MTSSRDCPISTSSRNCPVSWSPKPAGSTTSYEALAMRATGASIQIVGLTSTFDEVKRMCFYKQTLLCMCLMTFESE